MTEYDKFLETKERYGVDVGFETGKDQFERVKLHPDDMVPFGLNAHTLRKYKPLTRQQLKSMNKQRKKKK